MDNLCLTLHIFRLSDNTLVYHVYQHVLLTIHIIVPRCFCPTHFNCVDYDIFNLTKRCGGSKTGLYIYYCAFMSAGHVCVICGQALKHQEQNPQLSLIFVTNFHLQIFLCKKSSERKSTRLLWRAGYLGWASPQPRDKGEEFVVHLL